MTDTTTYKAEKPRTEHVSELAEEFIESLRTRTDLVLFNYFGALVKPDVDEVTGVTTLKTLTPNDLKWYLRRDFTDKPENVITTLASDILSHPDLPVTRINGLVATPVFREDMTLITAPGLDPATGLYYAPDADMSKTVFRTTATRGDALKALDSLYELLTDFPFKVLHKDRTAYLAGLLTLFARPSIKGIVPALAIDGNGQSVGKGLLSSMLSWIAYGHDLATMSPPKSGDEWESKIDAIVLSGSSFEVIDNIVGKFGCDQFASLLTSMRRRIRIKGVSKVVNVPATTFWVINGNSMILNSDIAQRLLFCNIQHPDAGGRKQEAFHVNKTYGCTLEELIKRDRPKYMQDCLDIFCAWVNAGQPRRKKVCMAKYGTWEAIIGGLLDWLAPGLKFLADHQSDVKIIDNERESDITFLHQLLIEFPDSEKIPFRAVQIANKVLSPVNELRNFLPDSLVFRDHANLTQRVGQYLKRMSTRTMDRINIKSAGEDSHQKVQLYLIKITKPEPEKPDRLADVIIEDEIDYFSEDAWRGPVRLQ